jgi:hypothetical protein
MRLQGKTYNDEFFFVASSRLAKLAESIQLLYQDYVYVGAGYT